MKKLYSTVLMLAVAAVAVAAPQRERVSVSPAAKDNHSGLSIAARSVSSPSRVAPAKAAPAGEWKAIGTGEYAEDLLTFYTDIPAGLQWEVEVEQNVENPGWYRFVPYHEKSPIAALYGADDEYLYINATDDMKVYAEDFYPYNEEISNLTSTTGWPENYAFYGMLVDGIISFEPYSFAIGYGDGWQQTSVNGGLKLALPGYHLPDYSIGVEAPYCVDGTVEFTIKRGKDIATLKFMVMEGEQPVSYIDPYMVVDDGEEVAADQTSVTYTATAPGIYTALVAGLDVDGNLVDCRHSCFIVAHPAAEAWKSIGTGVFHEDVYSSFYDEIDAVDLTVEIEENVEEPGYFRLVDPFKSHPVLAQYCLDHGHKHYIYINATNAEQVMVEPSPLGLSYICGEAAMWSRANSALSEGATVDEVVTAGYFGTLADGVITLPAGTAMISEKDFYEGEFLCATGQFKVTLPEGWQGIADVVIPETEGAVYFNLQGIEVDAASLVPGIYIERTATTARKVVVK